MAEFNLAKLAQKAYQLLCLSKSDNSNRSKDENETEVSEIITSV